MKALIAGVCLLAACHHEADVFDSRPLLEHQIGYLRQHSNDNPLWQLPGQTAFPDDLRWVGDDAVLVAWTEQVRSPPFFKIEPRDYVLYDRSTGAKRWSIPRREASQILSVSPTLVVRDAAGLSAYALTSGALIFTQALPPASTVTMTPDMILVGASEGGQWSVEALEASSGRGLWKTTHVGAGAVDLLVADNTVLVHSGGQACGLARDSGQQSFCFDGLPALLDDGGPKRLGKLWIFQTRAAPVSRDGRGHRGDGLTFAIDDAGALKWKRLLPETNRALFGEGDVIWLRGRATDGLALSSKTVNQLFAIRSTDGSELWHSEDLAEAYASPPVVSANRIFLTTGKHAWVFDSKKGATVHSEPLPSVTWERLPDHIVVDDERAVFVNETSVLALDKKTGRKLWSVDAHGSRGSAYQLAHLHFKNVLEATGGTGALEREKNRLNRNMDDLSASLATFNTTLQQSPRSMAGAAGLLGIGMAYVATTETLIYLNRMYRQAGAAAAHAFAAAKLSHVIALHLMTVQGSYYVRPIEWLWGQGVLVVDLKSGAWREVVTGPAENFSNHFQLHFPLALIGADGKLVTAGVGLDPTLLQIDNRFYDYNTVTRTLFELEGTPSNPPDAYAERTLLAPNTYEIEQLVR